MEGNGLPKFLESKFLSNSNALVLHIITNIRVRIIHISKHQVVVVAKFRCIYILTPFFLLIIAYYSLDYSLFPRSGTNGTSSDCTCRLLWGKQRTTTPRSRMVPKSPPCDPPG